MSNSTRPVLQICKPSLFKIPDLPLHSIPMSSINNPIVLSINFQKRLEYSVPLSQHLIYLYHATVFLFWVQWYHLPTIIR